MSGKINRLEKLVRSFSHWLNGVAGVALMVMLSLIVADIIGVKLFKQPIPGAIEMVGFIGVVVIAFALAYTQVMRGHIQVEFFVMHLSSRWQAIITALVSFLGMVLFGLLAWQSYEFARVLQTSGEVSMTQRIPFYPFVYALAFCCLPVCMVLLIEFLRSTMKVVQK